MANTKTAAVSNVVNVAKLPKGFDAWAIAEASRPDGVSRTKVREHTGQSCKWRGYMETLAQANGFKFEMKTFGTGRPASFFFTSIAKKAAKPAAKKPVKAANKKAA